MLYLDSEKKVSQSERSSYIRVLKDGNVRKEANSGKKWNL